MEINPDNYESWMLSYIDGELDASGERELMAFLEVHPSLKEELRVFRSLKLHPDPSIVFESKEILSRGRRAKLVRFWWIPAAAAALVLWVLVVRKVHAPLTGSRGKGLVIHLQQHPAQAPLPDHSRLMIPRAKPVVDSGRTIASANPVIPPRLKSRIPRSAPPSGLATSRPVSVPEPGAVRTDSSEIALGPVPPLPTSGVGRIMEAGTPPVLLVSPSGQGLAFKETQPEKVASALPVNSQAILSIQGNLGASVISRIARIQKFFSRKNPVLAKTDIVQIGPIEFVKPK